MRTVTKVQSKETFQHQDLEICKPRNSDNTNSEEI